MSIGIVDVLKNLDKTQTGRKKGRGMYLLIKFTGNFIEGEGNISWKETYYINPADIRRFLNRRWDEGLHRQKMAEYDRFLEKEGRIL